MNKVIKKMFLKISTFLIVAWLFSPLVSYAAYFEGDTIGQYINSIYKYAIGVVGILATIVIMIGGLIWITSMGNASRVSNAKDWIGAALTGLALAMFSYTLLFIINPDLVEFKEINPQDVSTPSEEIDDDNDIGDKGCCRYPTSICRPGIFEQICEGRNGTWNASCAQLSCSNDPLGDASEETPAYVGLGGNCDESSPCDTAIGLVCTDGTCQY